MGIYVYTQVSNCSMAHIISVLNPKGGSGKTTISIHLVRALQLEGFKVLLIDTDPQGSAIDWRRSSSDNRLFDVVGISNSNLEKDIPKIESDFDFIIIDGVAKFFDTMADSIRASDFVLIPVQPSALDIRGCYPLIEAVRQRQKQNKGKPQVSFLISRQITRSRLADEIKGALEQFEIPIFESRISQRVAYVDGISSGVTALELNKKSLASQETLSLTKELKEHING